MIALLDYGMGNRRSVEKALEHVGAQVLRATTPAEVDGADALVVPGVGAFPAAMERLRAAALDQAVIDFAASGRPVLGICLGMQLLFEHSSEMWGSAGLGLLGGEVRELRAPGLRIPHIGWAEVTPARENPLLAEPAPFYHVHSLVAVPTDADDILATAEHGERFATAVSRGNVHGVQFHPEKSSADGLHLLAAFAGLSAGTAGAAAVSAGDTLR